MSHWTARRGAMLTATALVTPTAMLLATPAQAQLLITTPAPATPASPTPASTTAPTQSASSSDAKAAKPVTALGGPVNASGNIRTFQGDVDPLGNIRTFAGMLTSSGNIRTFNGAINPYLGSIRAFGADANPLTGNVKNFWGQLTPTGGEAAPQITNLRNFVAGFDPLSVDLLNSWNAATTATAGASGPANYAATATKLGTLVTQSAAIWESAVTAKTGKSFADGFAAPLFARYGLDPANPASLAALDVTQRHLFLMDWYDGLVGYAGMDAIDHWMSAINWSPSLTETIGEGKRSVIGLLDFTVTGEGTANITKYSGVSTFSNGHGSAVASLMIAAHDGRGVMGIAPMASVVAYNPFDSTGTADWPDVRNGVLNLAQNGASIVNMSLGVPGYTLAPGWNGVFTDAAVAQASKLVTFVMAAGNDGSSQTQNIPWNFTTNPAFIVVGSVDPTGTISNFSNRPGSACLTTFGLCLAGNELMNRFIVAPGELIQVSDGQGGVTRMSGTSFAAPLVSGTVALIHDRWPWLAKYPQETVDIILRSAKDLGAKGTDPVYGRGMLDVTAALSPLSFDALRWYTYKDGKIDPTQASKIRDTKEQAKWEAKGMVFYAYEDIGKSFRDFAIPASTKLADQSVTTITGSNERLQAYIYTRFLAWAQTSGSPLGGLLGRGFTDFATSASPIPNGWGLNMAMSIAPRARSVMFKSSNVPFQSAVSLTSSDGRFGMTMGEGDGAVLIGGDSGFGLASDYDPYTGGANPLLGYASGGSYGQARVRLADTLTLATSLTGRTLRRDLRLVGLEERAGLSALGNYSAQAQTMSAIWTPAAAVRLTGTYSHLNEGRALLGMQSTDRNDFRDGSDTDGLTLSADVAMLPTLSVALTATGARTRAGGDNNFAVAKGGLLSSSFQLGVTKQHVFDRADRARFTIAQPLHLERGAIDATSVRVIDRQEGTLGPVTETYALSSSSRQFVGEAMYSRSLLGDTAQVSLFGRFNLRGDSTAILPAVMAGAGFSTRF